MIQTPECLTRRMVLVALRALLEDPRVGVRDLAGVLGVDPDLESEVLRRANGPEFWRQGPVEDLSTAVRLLGFRRIARMTDEMAEAVPV